MTTVEICGIRLETVKPIPVSFSIGPSGTRTVTFGGKYGEHDLTVNGIEASLGTVRFAENGRRWRVVSTPKLRRAGTLDYLSDAARKKVQTALAEQVPRLVEVHADRFDASVRTKGVEQGSSLHATRDRLRLWSEIVDEFCEVADLLAAGECDVTPCVRRGHVDRPFSRVSGVVDVTAEVRFRGDVVGYGFRERSWSTSIDYAPAGRVRFR